MNAPIVDMRTAVTFLRTPARRRAAPVMALLLGSFAAGCADKVFRPPVLGSPRITMQLIATGAQVGTTPKVLAVAVAYVRSLILSEKDSFRVLYQQVVPVRGGTAQVQIKVDLTSCLADTTRRGSRTGCSIYVGTWLHDSATFSIDSGDFTKNAYDYAFLGPFDAGPGNAPVIPAVNLAVNHFAVNHWEADEALRLGGSQTPTFLGQGPIGTCASGLGSHITGSPAGATSASGATIFGITNGFVSTGQNTGGNVAQLAILQNGAWSIKNGPLGVGFCDVAAFGANDVYLAGSDGLYHYDGSSISSVTAVREPLSSVGVATTAGGAKLLVAGTPSGSVWFGNTTTFTKSSTNTSQNIDGVCVTGPNEAFASSFNGGGLFRFDGTTWTATPTSFTQGKGSLQCAGPGQAFVIVNGAAFLKWTGSTWTSLQTSGLAGRLTDWAVVSPTEIYVVGDSASLNRAYFKFDGTTWRELGRETFTQQRLIRGWADPRGGSAYFATQGFGRVTWVNGTTVSPVSYSPSISDVIMTSANSAFAVGWNLFLARYDGSRWTVDPPPSGPLAVRILQGVWSDGPSNAWAVGNASTILHWDGAKWGDVSDLARPIVTPADSYNAVWGATGTVWIVGDASIIRCKAVSSCAPEPGTGTGQLLGIWGTSATNAYAVGSGAIETKRNSHFISTKFVRQYAVYL